jgi:hypothetical protein
MVGMVKHHNNSGAHYVDGDGPIPMQTIDSLNLDALDFLMLDIEGYEYDALQGGIGTITAFNPVIVVEEKHYRGTSKFGDTQKLLESIGYKIAGKKNRDVIYVVK